jgi:DNA-binding transcriptional MocR family regulator
VGVIEDDHAGPVAGVPAFSACAGSPRFPGPARWVTLRSVSKSLGPDLRLAVVAGDEATITRVAGRQALGTGWVSYELQDTVADLWSDTSVARTLTTAAQVYARRGAALRSALGAQGLTPTGRGGFTSGPRRAGRWRLASGSASRRRPVSGSPSPA